jgi:hypothetical protein
MNGVDLRIELCTIRGSIVRAHIPADFFGKLFSRAHCGGASGKTGWSAQCPISDSARAGHGRNIGTAPGLVAVFACATVSFHLLGAGILLSRGHGKLLASNRLLAIGHHCCHKHGRLLAIFWPRKRIGQRNIGVGNAH